MPAFEQYRYVLGELPPEVAALQLEARLATAGCCHLHTPGPAPPPLLPRSQVIGRHPSVDMPAE